MSAMVLLETPHVNILTKIDLHVAKKDLDRFIDPQGRALAAGLKDSIGSPYGRINNAVASLVDEFSMVSFLAMDINEEDNIASILLQIDLALHYGEDEEVHG